MKTCGVCGQSKETPHSCKVHTVRVLDQTTKKTGFKQYTTTTRYGDIEQHTYGVCRFCYIKWNFVLPLIVYLLFVVLTKMILLPDEGWGASLFLALIPALFVVWKYVIVSRKLIKDALSGKVGNYKGFNELEYLLQIETKTKQ
jgi:hypothetical protein